MEATLHTSSKIEELHRIIRSLNTDFQLHLQIPDPTLPPSKHQQHQTEEGERVYNIYRRAHNLNFNSPGHLLRNIGCFREQAYQLLKDWTVNKKGQHPDTPTTSQLPDPLRASVGAEERAVLQKLLQKMLNSAPTPTHRSKRTPPEFPDSRSKRPKEWSAQCETDHIPVRTSTSTRPLEIRPNDHDTSTARGDSFSTPVHRKSFTDGSVSSSSRTSFPASVFSTQTNGDVSESQATLRSNVDSFTYDRLHLSRELSRKPSEGHSYHDRIDDDIRGKLHSHTQLASNSSHCLDAIKVPAQTTSDGFAHDPPTHTTLSDRLAHIWPKFPTPALNQAPLIIIWELTRAAAHCNVDLCQWNLCYRANDSWHDLAKFRAKISAHPLFVGKSLPPACDRKTWAAALASFSVGCKIVCLAAELVFNEDTSGPPLTLKLQRPCLKLGNRLCRRFGADRFIEVLLPPRNSKYAKEDLGLETTIRWLTESSSHYFVGRSWIPFYTNEGKKTKKKDGNSPNGTVKIRNIVQDRVFFFATDGNQFKKPNTEYPPLREALSPSIRTKMKRSSLLGWAVNIEKNAEQPVAKLFSRLALSLSNTWPTVVLETSQIRSKPDIRNRDVNGKFGNVMNDGIGRMSRGLARKVAGSLGLTSTPCGFQARIGSAKGMWIVDIEDDGLDDEEWIEIYPSQEKWNCDFRDVHHRTFEVRDWPRELRPASLNQQFIPVLEAQAPLPGRMRKIIAKHLVNGLQKELDEQREAMKHPMDFRSWIKRTGSSDNHSTQGTVSFAGGLPERDEDIIAYLLDAGFRPDKLEFLHDMAWEFRKRQTELLKTKMNVQIPESTYAFMVVDFTGELKEGEVQLAFSSKFQVGDDSETLLDGMDVLVARSPAHFPSDIQKVKAVFKPSLKKLKDVIVFSTKGNSPLADMLSGGDYDGDRAWVCWDSSVVRNFASAPVPPQPDLIDQGYIRKFDLRFQLILDTHHNLESACITFLREAMNFSMQPSLLGACTNFKERHCYLLNSVTSQTAVVLCTLVGHLVDQSKQGLVFTNDDFRRLKQDMKMKSKDPEYEKDMSSSYVNRNGFIHILDYLKFDVAHVAIERGLEAFFKSIDKTNVTRWDSDLARLYNEAERQRVSSTTFKLLVDHLDSEIRLLEQRWKLEIPRSCREGSSEYKAKICQLFDAWNLIKPPRQLELSKMAKIYCNECNGNPRSNWALLKASATFKLCSETCTKMVWRLAGQQLCWIKAMSSSDSSEHGAVAVIPQMWSVLKPDSTKIKALAARREDSESAAALEETMDFDEQGNPFEDV